MCRAYGEVIMGRRVSPWYYIVTADSECGQDDMFGTIYKGRIMLTYTEANAERFTTRKQAEKFLKNFYMYKEPHRVREMFDHNL
jgi:hypothetical protein